MEKEEYLNLYLTERDASSISNSPLENHLSRYITDSTSLCEAVEIVESGFQELCAGALNYDEFECFIQAEVAENQKDIDDQILQGLTIFQRWNGKKVVQIFKANNTIANLAIRIGKVLLKLKAMVNKIKPAQWEVWAAENIDIKDGTRQLYMQLANHTEGVHRTV